jgi:hypothetical protein
MPSQHLSDLVNIIPSANCPVDTIALSREREA